MHPRRLTKLLLLPSISSGVLVVAAGLGLSGYNAWMYISNKQLFYDNLFGAYGLKTYVWEHSLGATTWKNSFLASPLAYYVFVVVASVSAALVTYTLVQMIGAALRGGRRALSELGAFGSLHKGVMAARLALRIISLAGWALYTTFFLSTLLPFVFVLSQTGIDRIQAGAPSGWAACAGGVVMLIVALHLQVVFARLIALRARLFLGDQAIEEAES